MADVEYTFELPALSVTRYFAGKLNEIKQSPSYTIEVAVPPHARDQVEIQLVRYGDGLCRLWNWDITNRSTYAAFVIIEQDGVVVEEVDREGVESSLSGFLCARHSMTTRSMDATQDQDRCGGASGAAADSG